MQMMKHPDGDWKCETWRVRFDGKPLNPEAGPEARGAYRRGHAPADEPQGRRN